MTDPEIKKARNALAQIRMTLAYMEQTVSWLKDDMMHLENFIVDAEESSLNKFLKGVV